jgi:hypothetical protein
MSAATIARGETVREGHAVLHLAMDAPACEAVSAAMVALGDALDIYTELDGDGLHWEQVYPELMGGRDPDWALDEALRKAADEVDAAAEDLIKAIAGQGSAR